MDISEVGRLYQQLDKSSLFLLKDIYHQNIVFEDAAHRLVGIEQLERYFQGLYDNVLRCDFDIDELQQVGETGFLTWTMHLQHPKLSKGKNIEVSGVSHLKFSEGKVIYHRDYFDLGEMLYENLPFLGRVVKGIKQRLAQ
ncbi:nuclear transport factor 2 family protein [Vibrio sp. TRT 21S02]|uniref:nuclear transport factor 2 family protein n=1 Tax=Vibrio sp. TRT 21S02 TaxID=3418507 RepID=UPI003CFB3848